MSSHSTTSGDEKEIQELRRLVDQVDDEILDLLNRRAALVIEIGKVKASKNKEFYAPKREQEIYRSSRGTKGRSPPTASDRSSGRYFQHRFPWKSR